MGAWGKRAQDQERTPRKEVHGTLPSRRLHTGSMRRVPDVLDAGVVTCDVWPIDMRSETPQEEWASKF